MAKLKASVVIEDMVAIQRLLDQLGKGVANKITRNALRVGSKGMLRTTIAHAPVDTGLMKASLTMRPLKRKRGRIGFYIGFKNVDALLEKSNRNPFNKKRYFYPAVVEYGSKNRTPKPFMRPAFEQHKEFALKAIKDQLAHGITQAAEAALRR